MKHYILVHGAWEGAWSWDTTRPVLEKKRLSCYSS
jgi:hypothetical protein